MKHRVWRMKNRSWRMKHRAWRMKNRAWCIKNRAWCIGYPLGSIFCELGSMAYSNDDTSIFDCIHRCLSIRACPSWNLIIVYIIRTFQNHTLARYDFGMYIYYLWGGFLRLCHAWFYLNFLISASYKDIRNNNITITTIYVAFYCFRQIC